MKPDHNTIFTSISDEELISRLPPLPKWVQGIVDRFGGDPNRKAERHYFLASTGVIRNFQVSREEFISYMKGLGFSVQADNLDYLHMRGAQDNRVYLSGTDLEWGNYL